MNKNTSEVTADLSANTGDDINILYNFWDQLTKQESVENVHISYIILF